jgi:hypothetical protein
MTKKTKLKGFQEVIYLNYTEEVSGGDICEGEEDSSYPCREDTYYNITWNYAILSTPKGEYLRQDYKSETILDEKLYEHIKTYRQCVLAVVVYSDGDSFGHSEGHNEIVGIFANSTDAQNCLNEIEEDRSDYSKPWNGYFSRLTTKKIVPLQVYL